jgi:hypothetical protein
MSPIVSPRLGALVHGEFFIVGVLEEPQRHIARAGEASLGSRRSKTFDASGARIWIVKVERDGEQHENLQAALSMWSTVAVEVGFADAAFVGAPRVSVSREMCAQSVREAGF